VSIRGWVYIIENIAMPDILKIGFSTKDPELRAQELAGTGSPHPFQVVYDALVVEPRSVEQAAHVKLASKREGKEWFRCSRAEAIEVVRACAKSILIERLNSNEDQVAQAPALCHYYACGKLGTSLVKGNSYCDVHGKTMSEYFQSVRKRKFDEARSIRDIGCRRDER
jgi:hypothetical protein